MRVYGGMKHNLARIVEKINANKNKNEGEEEVVKSSAKEQIVDENNKKIDDQEGSDINKKSEESVSEEE